MPMIQIEQDHPDIVRRARETIAEVARASNEHRVSYDYAVAIGWIVGLCREQVISTAMSETLRGELNVLREAWRAPVPASE